MPPPGSQPCIQENGTWLSSPEIHFDKHVRPEGIKDNERAIKIAGIVIFIITLILIFNVATGIMTIFGLLNGYFVAFSIHASIAIYNDRHPPPSGDLVTQQSMQKFLEDAYGDVMWQLLEEARENPNQWRKRVRTQAGLEAWAAETCDKLGYPPRMI